PMTFFVETRYDSTKTEESVSTTISIILHLLMLLWNPAILQSNYKPIHDFVQIDVVDQSIGGGGGGDSEEPKKASLMDTLKDMLMKPRSEDIAHVAPEPLTHRVAAPTQPPLQNKEMPTRLTHFQPKSQTEDLTSASTPNQIKTQEKNFNIPTAGPSLTQKNYGGIRAKDLPFQVGTDQQIAGGNASVIPVAIGNTSAKAGLG